MNKEEKSSNKCPICGRPTHKESEYCIFHASAEEKTEKDFKKTLKEYIDKAKKEDSDYHFEKFIFVGDIDFKKDLNITVFKNADFREATFKGDADFREATFKGDTGFREATFERHDSFNGATFKGNADFGEAIFKGNADFGEAIFEGNVNFFVATFKGNAVFEQATFKGNADFGLKSLVGIIDFSEIRIFSGKKLSIKIFKEVVEISFEHAYLENTDLDIEIVKDTLIDFTGALLKNTKIKKGKIEKHILQEEKKNYYKAKENYLILKNNFHSIGQYDDESWAYKKEKDMERKSNFHFKTLHKWLWSCFLNAIYGYGERPWNVVITSVVIILLFSLFFTFNGIGNPEIVELHGDISLSSNQDLEIILKGNIKNTKIMQFFDCVYFSLITFTTLGYGDFRPLEGWGRILAGSEAFIGAFMMALFVYTFARRTGGR